MLAGLTGNPLSTTYSTGSDAAQLDPVSHWEKNAPKNEDRSYIASQIRDACSTGTLEICAYDISSLPPLPKELSSLTIHCIGDKLSSLPPLPNDLKQLKLINIPNLEIPCFPENLEDITLINCKNIECFPKLPTGLLHLSVDSNFVVPLPEGLLTLKLDDCNGLSAIPKLPDSLKKLQIYKCKDLEISSLPNNLEEITLEKFSNIKQLKLPDGLLRFSVNSYFVPALPEGLLSLSLEICDGLSALPELPGSLKTLEIKYCDEVKLPTELPSDLSQILLYSSSRTDWDIQPQNIPPNVNIATNGKVKINPECLKVPGVTYDNTSIDAAMHFRPGDIVYGTAHGRGPVFRAINILNDFSDKDIVMQNTLTNAIWDSKSFSKFRSDEEIKQTLNDYDRAMDFKSFLENHERYNVTNIQKFNTLTITERLSKTSKAGLEFQTSVREKSVIFCVDHLVDSIPDIASKSGPHGQAITAHELRWIYRHRDDDNVKENVKFFLRGAPVSHESVFSLTGWDKYQPKYTTKIPTDHVAL